jgi:hypothetical protein
MNPNLTTTTLSGATEVDVNSVDELMALLTTGQQNRTTSESKISPKSSQSHAIVTIKLTQRLSVAKENISRWNFVDLAGTGQHCAAINKSLYVGCISTENCARRCPPLPSCYWLEASLRMIPSLTIDTIYHGTPLKVYTWHGDEGVG